jgi:hypothetical protein
MFSIYSLPPARARFRFAGRSLGPSYNCRFPLRPSAPAAFLSDRAHLRVLQLESPRPNHAQLGQFPPRASIPFRAPAVSWNPGSSLAQSSCDVAFPAGPIPGSLRKGRALCRRPAARNTSPWPRRALLRLAPRGARHNSRRIGSKSPSFAPSWPLFSRPSTTMNLRRVRLNGQPAHRRLKAAAGAAA